MPSSFVTRLGVWLRSLGVGALATFVDLAALAVLVSALGVDPRVASPAALALGVACQFVGNKWFAFRDRSPRWLAQALLFGYVEALAFALNVALYEAAVRAVPLPYLALRLGTTSLVYFTVCLPLWTLLFAERGQVAS